MPDSTRAIVAYSGGKDSTATLLWALERYQQVTPVFNNTRAEWPETYQYLAYVEEQLGLPIVRASNPKWPGGLYQWIEHYHYWPSAVTRSCTHELKRTPLRHWLTSNAPDGDVLFGQRAEESAARALLPERDGRILRPILSWSTQQVKDFIKAHGLKLNPVYAYVDRANCCVCPLGKPSSIRAYAHRYPEGIRPWLELENATGKTWRDNMSLRMAAQTEQGSLFDTTTFSSCLIDGLCDLGEGCEP